MKPQAYDQKVAAYYDEEAPFYLQRSRQNFILTKLREQFRAHTEEQPFEQALEIGFGPGEDLLYFSRRYPERRFYGLDVSPEMTRQAHLNLQEAGLTNAEVFTGSLRALPETLARKQFDLVYVYFGGLNTSYHLEQDIPTLEQLLKPGGRIVLTMVNRRYLMDAVVKILKGNIQEALARWQNRWQGYALYRQLPSHLYTSEQIKEIFNPSFSMKARRGFSIFYPPWYAAGKARKIAPLLPWLWRLDQGLQKTPFWNLGEYSLYELEKQKT